MKLNELLEWLTDIRDAYGDIECQLQSDGMEGSAVINYEDFFVVTEPYDDGWRVNLRSWPY